jgi:glycine/D-amino acid oxidase-like deaminating enzyme
MEPSASYDVAIVGAGLAGLAAACALRDRRIVVLEREQRAGGRVLTCSRCDVPYDLGAVFAFDPARSPVPIQLPPALRESERVGLHQDGATVWGSSVEACIAQLGLSSEEHGALAAFAAGTLDAAALPPRLARALGAFFRVIHPSALAEALPQRQRDALIRFPTPHHAAGNGQLADALAQALGPRLRLSSEVSRIEEKSGLVELTLRSAAGTEVIAARAVICATPGATALRLITSLTNDRCRVFLEGLRWGGGTVVVLALAGADLPDFSYLVTPDCSFNTVLLQRGRQGQPDLLFVYYVGSPPPSPRLEQTLAELRSLKLGALRAEQVVFSDVRRWDAVGPVISPASYGAFDEWEARACERVFLAGDYTWVERDNVLPFGIDQALASGARAAERVARYLDVPSAVERYRSEYLVECTIYQLSGERPQALQTKQECNLSYWGTVLQAEALQAQALQADPDPALRRYLLQSTREGLWEYQTGFGVTADDSVLACEGLLAAGEGAETLGPSLRRLVELFYDRQQGAFLALSHQCKTIKACAQGRAEYWFGASLDATAQAAWLLERVLPGEQRAVVEACGRYVARAQRPDGGFSGLWFPSTLLTTWHAVRLLAALAPAHEQSLQRALGFLLRGQAHDGSWSQSVIETSAAVLALDLLCERAGIPRALAWLEARRSGGGWSGEPLLYYWFELSPGQKLFFHCRDRGRVTSAWAQIALHTIRRAAEGGTRGTQR